MQEENFYENFYEDLTATRQETKNISDHFCMRNRSCNGRDIDFNS